MSSQTSYCNLECCAGCMLCAHVAIQFVFCLGFEQSWDICQLGGQEQWRRDIFLFFFSGLAVYMMWLSDRPHIVGRSYVVSHGRVCQRGHHWWTWGDLVRTIDYWDLNVSDVNVCIANEIVFAVYTTQFNELVQVPSILSLHLSRHVWRD